jgi:hypothetical protein
MRRWTRRPLPPPTRNEAAMPVTGAERNAAVNAQALPPPTRTEAAIPTPRGPSEMRRWTRGGGRAGLASASLNEAALAS